MKITEKFLLDNGFREHGLGFEGMTYQGFNTWIWREGKFWRMRSLTDASIMRVKVLTLETTKDLIGGIKELTLFDAREALLNVPIV